jgi:FkbM family methyltransferase
MALHPGRFVQSTAELAALGPARADKARNAFVAAALWAKKRLGRRGGRLWTLRIAGPRGPLVLAVCEYTDLEAVREVFVAGTYAAVDDAPARTILDLGGNCGASVTYFKATHPDAQIHVAEPDPIAFRTLQANVRQLDGVTLHHVAVGGVDGRLPFFQSHMGWSSSLTGDQTHAGGGWIEVDVVRLSTLMSRARLERVDVLKMDVEGAEWDILPAVRLADVADLVIGEFHDRNPDHEPLLDQAFDGLEVEYLEEPASHFVAQAPTA